MHDVRVTVMIVDRIVLRAAVVPERERAGLPAQTAGEFGAHLVSPAGRRWITATTGNPGARIGEFPDIELPLSRWCRRSQSETLPPMAVKCQHDRVDTDRQHWEL